MTIFEKTVFVTRNLSVIRILMLLTVMFVSLLDVVGPSGAAPRMPPPLMGMGGPPGGAGGPPVRPMMPGKCTRDLMHN